MTSPIAATTAPTTTATPTTNTAAPGTLGKDAFLQLLVAQLRYQDPSKPVDSAEFMAQSAQFTMVEAMEEMSKNSEEALTAQRLGAAAAYLGRTVTGPGADGTDITGAVTSVTLDPTSGPLLHLDTGSDLPLTAVRTITTPTTPATPTTTTTDQPTQQAK